MIPERLALWAMNYDPEWLARNYGTPDMVIMTGTLHDVHYAHQRVAMLAGDGVQLDVRDLSGGTVYTVREIPNPGHNPTLEIVAVYPRPEQTHERKARRKLGTREN